MDYKEILDQIGNKASEFSTLSFNKLSETLGVESSSLSIKILTIIILLGGLFLASKITQKAIKISLYILIPLLIISLVYSLF